AAVGDRDCRLTAKATRLRQNNAAATMPNIQHCISFVSEHLFLSTTIQNYERSSNVLINTAITYNEQDSSKSLRDPRGLKFEGATQSRRHPGRTARGRREAPVGSRKNSLSRQREPSRPAAWSHNLMMLHCNAILTAC